MSSKFLGVHLFVWSALCIIIALIFGMFMYQGVIRGNTGGIQYFILRWAHPLLWLILGVSFFIRGINVNNGAGLANILALLSLGLYLVFIVTLVTK